MTALSTRQREVLEFLQAFSAEQGFMPTQREICKHFDWSSQTSAASILAALEKKGVIRRPEANSCRAIVITEEGKKELES